MDALLLYLLQVKSSRLIGLLQDNGGLQFHTDATQKLANTQPTVYFYIAGTQSL